MGSKKNLHLVAFNIPYPPDYGGVIDIFYKIKALRELGISVILHAYVYNRPEAEVLESLVTEVHYYQREKGLTHLLKRSPYIVNTRNSKPLLENLLKDDYPVLFEGLHTTAVLEACKEAGKKVFVRTHNIEHNYYNMLARSERRLFKKAYLFSDARKLEKYEAILKQAEHLFCISTTDTKYFNGKYGKSTWVSAFHQQAEVNCKDGKGDYILFHGNLSVPENENAVLYLVKKVLSKIEHRVIIAGKDPGKYLRTICSKYKHIRLIANPDEEEMNKLVSNAHINLLYTYQPTGLKLKLLHSLYGGRFCLANPLMLSGSGLEDLCVIYRNPDEAIQRIEHLMQEEFLPEEINRRMEALKSYDNLSNAKKIMEQL